MEGHHPLGIEHGMLWVVTGEQDGVPPQGQGGHPLQHPHLVAEVQGGGGLIHQQQPGLLGQSPGRQYKLLLSTGQLREAPVGVVCDPQLLQGLHGDGPLPAARRGEKAQPAVGAHEHQLQRRVGKDHMAGLGNIGDFFGQGAGRQG